MSNGPCYDYGSRSDDILASLALFHSFPKTENTPTAIAVKSSMVISVVTVMNKSPKSHQQFSDL